jgi:hypothetical protein
LVSAVFSPCRTWRYTLTRYTGIVQPVREELVPLSVAFIGLNPSTADETTDDPTVRRCIGFARRWGYERMVMLNVFAFRATNPRRLRAAEDPIGPENDNHIAWEAALADLVVCAWGVHATLLGRGVEVKECLEGINVPLHVLGLTKDGHPKHPLYLKGDLEPVSWT